MTAERLSEPERIRSRNMCYRQRRGNKSVMPKDSDITDLLANVSNKKCRRCGIATKYADFGDVSILCDDCEKIEAKEESAKELSDFDRNPVFYDIDEVLDGRKDFDVLAYFSDTLPIPDQRLLPAEKIPTFIGRLSCEWRNGFHYMVVESNHAILFKVIPSLRQCGATRAADAVSECLEVLDRFEFRKLMADHSEPYSALDDSDRSALEEILHQLDSKWRLFVDVDREMQIAAHGWLVDHRDDFVSRRSTKASQASGHQQPTAPS